MSVFRRSQFNKSSFPWCHMFMFFFLGQAGIWSSSRLPFSSSRSRWGPAFSFYKQHIKEPKSSCYSDGCRPGSPGLLVFFFPPLVWTLKWVKQAAGYVPLRLLLLFLHFSQGGGEISPQSAAIGALLFLQRSTFGGILCEGNGEHSWAVSHAVYW